MTADDARRSACVAKLRSKDTASTAQAAVRTGAGSGDASTDTAASE